MVSLKKLIDCIEHLIYFLPKNNRQAGEQSKPLTVKFNYFVTSSSKPKGAVALLKN